MWSFSFDNYKYSVITKSFGSMGLSSDDRRLLVCFGMHAMSKNVIFLFKDNAKYDRILEYY